MNADLPDIATLVGVLLVGIAVFMALGAAGVIGFAGAVLIVLGVATAQNRALRRQRGKEQA